ncbi:uncharacterized protein LOC135469306 isoform X2 [Liolophura sinensis]|uniref:uncharacterized protein LOC135469306 isoform X2 n=1 Tax=Liolophura sinensis TaxID=3198878 RepID=UPI0031587739
MRGFGLDTVLKETGKMGVSLERVQNKFACIIGELCNEPFVLSQFAVWLDMRLAEYKAKGSICLECCGDIPNPSWLKGLPLQETHDLQTESSWPPTDDTGQAFRGPSGSAHTSSRRIPSKHQNQTFRSSNQQSSDISHHRLDSHVSMSHHSSPAQSLPSSPITNRPLPVDSLQTDMGLPSDIVVKQEVFDDSSAEPVVPVSMHTHEEIQSELRKRTSDSISDVSSSRKVQKVFHSSSDVAPINESLSSIISFNQEGAKLDSQGSVDSVVGVSVEQYNQSMDDDDIEILEESFMQQGAGTDLAVGIANSSDSDTSRFSQGDSLYLGESSQQGNNSTDVRPSEVSGRNKDLFSCPGQPSANLLTQRKTASSVRLFQRWLLLNADEERPVKTLSPRDLDAYLVRFLSTCQKVDGGEYSAKSLKGLRESIERHLKDSGYPFSIISSPEFYNSQQVYKTRFQFLRLHKGTNI